MRRSVCLVALLLASAGTALGWPGRPPNPPAVQGTSGPPPAWIETTSRSLWLAFSSFCWQTTCADYLPPRSRPGLPFLRVSAGALVRVHFGFRPTQVRATIFLGTTMRTTALRPGRVVEWRPRQTGVFSLDVKAAAGSTSYVLRLDLR